MHKHYIFCLFTLVLFAPVLKAQSIITVNTNKTSSIRGLSVVNNMTAWVSGSKGTVGITTDGGKTWTWPIVKGFEKADFRDVEASSEKEALIMSSGTPALILKTTDAGATWKVKYQNDDKAYFLDAMEFDNSLHGLILGDPIDGKFLILETNDGGNSWQTLIKSPKSTSGEAAFAASGTCLRAYNNTFFIVTGGSQANFIKQIGTHDWQSQPIPVTHGKESQGIFSLAISKKHIVFVGGDYSKPALRDSAACYIEITSSAGKFQLPSKNLAGFQSCVEYLDNDNFLSTGSSGTNLTVDGGRTWNQIDTISFNVCRKAKRGNLTLLAGDDGKIGIFKL